MKTTLTLFSGVTALGTPMRSLLLILLYTNVSYAHKLLNPSATKHSAELNVKGLHPLPARPEPSPSFRSCRQQPMNLLLQSAQS